jgi:ferredoxin-NADP reductase
MLRHWTAGDQAIPARLLYSSRALDDVIYRQELTEHAADVHLTLTREWPEDWQGHRGRVDQQLLDELAWPPDEQPLTYICGPTAFVESVAETLVKAGHEPDRIKTERFGPTGT